MESEAVFILLFAVSTAVAVIARRIRAPYTVALVLAGLVLGTLHALEVPHLTKDLLFSVFLPGLLFEAAFHMQFARFWRNRLATLSLAVPGVAAGLALTALILVPLVDQLQIARGFDWQHALVLGAVLAATDPVAVVGLFRSLGVPPRLGTLIEGESLLNDGTSIVLFSLVLAGATGAADLGVQSLATGFATAVGIGVLVGGGVGLAVSEAMKRIDDPMIEITLTTIAAYGAFVTAEHLHSSGVIATVTAGLLCGNYGAPVGMSPTTRIAVETFWEYVAFALNSVVFLLIGFEVRLDALLSSWLAIAAAYVAMLTARVGVVGVVSLLLRPSRERIPPPWSIALTWGGLRGALSMVLVLSLPLDFALRDLLITMTFGVVIVSLLVQGLTMAPLLRWLGLVEEAECRAQYETNRGRAQTAAAALAALEEVADHRAAAPPVLEGLRQEYRDRLVAAEEAMQALPLSRQALRQQDEQWLRRRLLLVEKQRLIELLREGVLSRDTYERLVGDVDTQLIDLDSGRVDAIETAAPAADRGPAGARARSPS
jgi:CPA1 family monovalent cation:H+ antiporter